jgi:hypothetical protein
MSKSEAGKEILVTEEELAETFFWAFWTALKRVLGITPGYADVENSPGAISGYIIASDRMAGLTVRFFSGGHHFQASFAIDENDAQKDKKIQRLAQSECDMILDVADGRLRDLDPDAHAQKLALQVQSLIKDLRAIEFSEPSTKEE